MTKDKQEWFESCVEERLNHYFMESPTRQEITEYGNFVIRNRHKWMDMTNLIARPEPVIVCNWICGAGKTEMAHKLSMALQIHCYNKADYDKGVHIDLTAEGVIFDDFQYFKDTKLWYQIVNRLPKIFVFGVMFDERLDYGHSVKQFFNEWLDTMYFYHEVDGQCNVHTSAVLPAASGLAGYPIDPKNYVRRPFRKMSKDKTNNEMLLMQSVLEERFTEGTEYTILDPKLYTALMSKQHRWFDIDLESRPEKLIVCNWFRRAGKSTRAKQIDGTYYCRVDYKEGVIEPSEVIILDDFEYFRHDKQNFSELVEKCDKVYVFGTLFKEPVYTRGFYSRFSVIVNGLGEVRAETSEPLPQKGVFIVSCCMLDEKVNYYFKNYDTKPDYIVKDKTGVFYKSRHVSLDANVYKDVNRLVFLGDITHLTHKVIKFLEKLDQRVCIFLPSDMAVGSIPPELLKWDLTVET